MSDERWDISPSDWEPAELAASMAEYNGPEPPTRAECEADEARDRAEETIVVNPATFTVKVGDFKDAPRPAHPQTGPSNQRGDDA